MSFIEQERGLVNEIPKPFPTITYIGLPSLSTYFEELVNPTLPQMQACSLIRANGIQVADPDNTHKVIEKSDIDGADKWTEGAVNCSISALVGQNPEGNSVSVLTHMSPGVFDYRYAPSESARRAYIRLIDKFAQRTVGDRYAFIFGGTDERMRALDGFITTSNRAAKIHQKRLDIPTLVQKPAWKDDTTPTNVFISTKDRAIYLIEIGGSRDIYTVHPSRLWSLPEY